MPSFGPDRWQRVSPYLDQALDMPRTERRAWLASLSLASVTLSEDLQALLAEHDVLDHANFLDTPVLAAGGTLAGLTVGTWTLVSLVGQGGMGSVWLARRSDGRFEGAAAVKLLNTSLVGAAGEDRFTREGTILARLTHPSIARLIDAGIAPSGQPYLVLEYVPGERIDRYCDGRSLSIEARIRLFLDVLAAVAHAHANLVVHRDIKPSNVLVRTDQPDARPSASADAARTVGRVALLDFGIAKLLEEETAALTRGSGWALTPEYAAPEQLTGKPLTTATDVYSLGVLLYELLAGQHPAGTGLLSPAELISSIVSTDARRLSDVVVDPTRPDADTIVAVAANRGSTPDKLRRALHGDLDTIVAKALAKDPQNRYLTVSAFADDLQRYLDRRPISARPQTLRYRAGTFVRRNRMPVALAAIALLALIAGLGGTVSQARRAQEQAARADRAARTSDTQREFALRQLSRVEAINDLNAFLLSETAPSAKRFTAAELLGRAEEIVERQQESDENHVEMLIELGRRYWTIDRDDKGRMLLRRAYDLSRALSDLGTRARASCALAPTLPRVDERERAEQLAQEGLATLPNEPQYALHRVFCLMSASQVAGENGEDQQAIDRAMRAKALLKESRLSSPLLEYQAARQLAESYSMVGRFREANLAYADAAQRLASLGRDSTEPAGSLYNNWAISHLLLGHPFEAAPLFQRAIQLLDSPDPSLPHAFPTMYHQYARTLADLHQFAEAARYAERAYAISVRTHNELMIGQSLLTRASIYRQRGDFGRAARMLAEAAPHVAEITPAENPMAASMVSEQALLAQARGDEKAAMALSNQAVKIAGGADHAPNMPRFLVRRSQLELQLGMIEQAHADAVRAVGLEQAAGPGIVSSGLGRARLILARTLYAEGKVAEARTEGAAAVDQLTISLGPEHPDTRMAKQIAAGEAAATAPVNKSSVRGVEK
jgi:eukaryotic-like serine/threonine-protein kinase